jgi:hypothetical protein
MYAKLTGRVGVASTTLLERRKNDAALRVVYELMERALRLPWPSASSTSDSASR